MKTLLLLLPLLLTGCLTDEDQRVLDNYALRG